MKKEFEGYVDRDLEYGYIGVSSSDVGDTVNDMISQYEGSWVKVTVIIEEIENEKEDGEEDEE